MNKLYITALSLVLAVILMVVLLWPKYQDLQELTAFLEQKETELQLKKDYFSQLRETSRKLEEYGENLSKINSALPEDPSLPSLFDYIQQTASQTGLLLEKIELRGIKPAKKNSKIREIHLNFILSGLYPDFKNFLSALEKSARLIQVQKIMFSTPQDLEEPFSFKVGIKTYAY